MKIILPENDGIKVAALVRNVPNDESQMELVLRWKLLREGQQLMPRADESFSLQVLTRVNTGNARYLTIAGIELATPHSISVLPKRFAMVDPPREKRDPRTWDKVDYTTADPSQAVVRVAKRPPAASDRPIECGALVEDKEWDETAGVGVCDLLLRTQQSTVAEFFHRTLKEGMEAVMAHFLDQSDGESVFATIDKPELQALVHDVPRNLADLLAWDPRSVFGLREEVIAEFEKLTGFGVDLAKSNDQLQKVLELRTPLLLGICGTSDPFLGAAFLSRLLGDTAMIRRMDYIKDQVETARAMLGLNGDAGGSLVDFWCAPPGETAAAQCGNGPSTRGRAYPAACLFGLGLNIPLSRMLVEEWYAEAGGAGEICLEIMVSSSGGSRVPMVRYLANGLVRNWEDESFAPGQQDIAKSELDLALRRGSSIPITQPDSAFVNFKLLQSDEGTDIPNAAELTKAPSFAATTGDGNVEILIDTKTIDVLASAGKSIVRGFNVYSMWDTGSESTAPFFDVSNPRQPSKASEIRQWLVTRRYSYRRDLAGYLIHEPDALRNLLLNPPWMPLVPRSGRTLTEEPIKDGEEGGPSTLIPDEFNVSDDGQKRKLTTWQFDLRTGITPDPDPSDQFIGWQPKEDPNVQWSPEWDRKMTALTSPQRYRFWVTSVDMFDQESTPVPVAVLESDAGTFEYGTDLAPSAKWFFSPLRRARILVPEQDLVKDDNATRLTIRCKLPKFAQISSHNDPTKPVKDPDYRASDYTCRLLLLRRPLRHAVDHSPKPARIASSVYPQWQKSIDYLVGEGWQTWGGWTPLMPVADTNYAWVHVLELKPRDQGYEYIAALGVEISHPDKLNFWTRRNDAREVQLINNGKLEIIKRPEIPFAADLAVTKPVSVANPNLPLPLNIFSHPTDLLVADSVIPVPSLQRDPLIKKMLALRLSGGEPNAPWADTGIVLTHAQIALIRTAMTRCRSGFDIETAPALSLTRRLLALSCTRSVDPARIGRVAAAELKAITQGNEIIGFRGILRKSWIYTPRIQSGTEGDQSAEATLLQIYQIHVPEDPSRARAYATVAVAQGASFTGGSTPKCSFPLPIGSGWTALREGPAMAMILTKEAKPRVRGYYSLVNSKSDGSRVICELAPLSIEDGSSSSNVEVLWFLPPLLHEEKIPASNEEVTGEVYLPIGGGRPERYVWWIATVSAEQKKSFCHVSSERFGWSIEPDVPSLIQVRTHQSGWPDLDPMNPKERPFIPEDAASYPKFFPNLYISWGDMGSDVGELRMLIDREQIAIDEPNRLLTTLDPQWEILSRIEQDAVDLLKSEIDLLSQQGRGWLDGAEILGPEDSAGFDKHVIFIDSLSAADGLVMISGDKEVPAFVDYFRHPMHQLGGSRQAMDGKFLYRYRLRTGYALPIRPGSDPKFILSQPSGWSPFVRPEARRIVFSADISEPKSIIAATPRVIFKFNFDSAKALLRMEEQELWVARILIRQVISQTFVSEPDRKPSNSYRYLTGTPTDVPLNKLINGSVEIKDLGLERCLMQEDLALCYQIAINQLIIHTQDGVEREEMLRFQKEPWDATKELELIIPGLSGNTDDELEITVGVDVSTE